MYLRYLRDALRSREKQRSCKSFVSEIKLSKQNFMNGHFSGISSSSEKMMMIIMKFIITNSNDYRGHISGGRFKVIL